MGQQETHNYRGKGTSTKLTKDGQPKHAGNWSFHTIHHQSLQHQDYRVRRIDGKLIVGDHTPLNKVLPQLLVDLIESDPNFKSYKQQGTHTHAGKKYEAYKYLTKFSAFGTHMYIDYQYIYREEIYTDGEFDYQFPNY